MDLDPDLEPDLEAMKGFIQSMSAKASQHCTIDQIQDEEEDNRSDSHRSYNDTSDEEDKEENAVFEVEEEMLIAESEGGRPHEASRSDHSDEADDSSDDELSPGANFEARLHRVHEKSCSTKPATAAAGNNSEDELDTPFPQWNQGDSDNDYITRIEVSQFPSLYSTKADLYLQHMHECIVVQLVKTANYTINNSVQYRMVNSTTSMTMKN
ncbi:hypothetical protein F4604DRAFT_1692452 [Suillus subluteus]|nr:hypothetical protein F4604DRAFT_1692452 [Suillus subluteus]